MEVLKIATAGSVDDGKSTLIGRLLYDTKSLTTDKLEAIEEKSKANGFDYIDFSLATDGLVAEREQGITIDVAHIYFSTAKKSYIIADTPGHVEYTRNMVTGASTSQAAIILVDARKGVVEQTYRHFFINDLLRVKEIVVAVNKMDLVDYSEEIFSTIIGEFKKIAAKQSFKAQKITFIPISALNGANVVKKSEEMPWFKGLSILDHLEALTPSDKEMKGARFSVQTIIRPKQDEYHDFRGYAGKTMGGDLKVGDQVMVLPSGNCSKIKEIQFYKTSYKIVTAGTSCTITLEDDINVSRGDVLVLADHAPELTKQLTASVCWMDTLPLKVGANYKVQQGTSQILAKVRHIHSRLHTDFSGEEACQELTLNEVGKIDVQLSKPFLKDSFASHKSTGSFILIDPQSNATAGIGFIE
ncbi:sulfate adenylyltransferase subunit 1 [Dokdonia sp. Hel_I_53]|uniref:sulfate adenylyltransferase subunit 1 n=1 Tax=Dokdonia sp. Hel_I_53 TaxID=1566287 RepID=UPI00119B3BE2|nr:GTP-binding protein [Dokdonia sp. Hel_I_53]TVZ51586.1 sulfate adenylyltransferase subunit 1 [Dokdonia sp. Hel_I_53]